MYTTFSFLIFYFIKHNKRKICRKEALFSVSSNVDYQLFYAKCYRDILDTMWCSNTLLGYVKCHLFCYSTVQWTKLWLPNGDCSHRSIFVLCLTLKINFSLPSKKKSLFHQIFTTIFCHRSWLLLSVPYCKMIMKIWSWIVSYTLHVHGVQKKRRSK